jgi:RHS repeat-associated protein
MPKTKKATRKEKTMGGPSFLRRRICKKLANFLVLVLIASFAFALVPQNVLSFSLDAAVDAPLFASIPTVPTTSATSDSANVGASQDLNTGVSQPSPAGDISTGAAQIVHMYSDVSMDAAQMVYVAEDITLGAELLNTVDVLNDSDSGPLGVRTTPEIDFSLPLVAVKLQPEATESQLAELVATYTATILGKVPGTNIYKVQCSSADASQLMQGLRSSAVVDSIERDRRYGPDRTSAATEGAITALRSKLVEVSLQQDSYWEEVNAIQLQPGGPNQPLEEMDAAASSVTVSPPVVTVSSGSQTSAATSAVSSQYGASTENTASQSEAVSGTAAVTVDSPVLVTTAPITGPETPSASLYEISTSTPAVDSSQTVPPNVTKSPAPDTGQAQQSPASTPQIATVSEDKVPIKAVGSSADPVEYAAPTGDVDVRFSSKSSISGNLVDVSNGDKGFTISIDNSSQSTIASAPATVSDSGVSYVDPSGAHLLFTPTSKGLSGVVTFAPELGNTLSINLPLYGLFADQTLDGNIALIDIDTGRPAFTIAAGQANVGGSPVGKLVLSLIDSADNFVRLLMTSPSSDQSAGATAGSLATNRFSPAVGRFEIAYEDESGSVSINQEGLSIDIAGSSGSRVPAGYLASLSLGDGQILYGAAASTAAIATRLGNFTVFKDGAAIADLRVKPINFGIEEEIVLNNEPASNSFELPISLSSLSLKQTLSGSVDVLDINGLRVASIQANLMYDSRPASEGGPARSGLVKLELIEKSDGTKRLVVTADTDWLNDPARVYPVFIDPTTSTSYPSQEAIVPSSTPTFSWSWSSPAGLKDSLIEIATDPGYLVGSEIHYEHQVFYSDWLGPITKYTLPAVKALPEGRYYWRSWVKDNNGAVACSNCDPTVSAATVFYVNTTHICSLYGSLPAKLPAGATVSVPITVKNRGTATWNASGADRYDLSYHLYNSSGGLITWEGARTALPYDLPPGQEVTLNATFTVPSLENSSQFSISWDMVQEGIAWFSERGEHPFSTTSTVQTPWNATYTPADWQAVPTATSGTLVLNINLTNTGTNTWYASGTTDVMKLNGRWIDASGNQVADGGSGASLPNNIAGSGGTASVSNWNVNVPSIPGAYIFKVDLYNVSAGEYMSSEGVQTLDLPIMVSAYGVMPDVSFAKLSDSAQLNLVSGNLVIGATDFTSNGRGPPINITRSFNTLSTDAGAFGTGWSSILDSKLNVYYNADQKVQSVRYLSADGAALTFLASQIVSGYQTFIHPRGLFATLTQKQSDGTFQLVNQDQTLTYYFTAPVSGVSQLSSIVDNNGNTTTFNYTGGRVISISEASGDSARSVQINYVAQGQNGAGNVAYIKVPSSDSARGYSFWAYGYDASNRLISAVFDPANDPDTGNLNSNSLAIPATYTYTGSPARLTGVTTKYGASSQDSTTTIDYDSSTGRLIKIHDPRADFSTYGTSVSYSADQSGRNVSITNAAGGCISFFLGMGLQTISSTTSQGEAIFEETFANSDLSNWGPIATNVAPGRNTTSSGDYSASYNSGHIIDGSYAESGAVDYWLPPANQDVNNPAWVQVDLGSSYVVNGMRFLPTRDGNSLLWATRNWHITVSNDNVVWTDVARGSLPGAVKVNGQWSPMLWNEVKMSPSLVRYVRFYVDSYSGYGGGLNELQVYGTPVGAVPSSAWSVGTNPDNPQEKVIKAAPFTSSQAYAEEYMVSKDSYSNFAFETSIRTENPGTQPNVGIIFRETNAKTNFAAGDGSLGDDGVNAQLGCYFFRASGIDSDANGKLVTLWKRENNTWTCLASSHYTSSNPSPGTEWYKVRVEAVGSQIKCYYKDMTTPLISVRDWSFVRGRVGFAAVTQKANDPNTTPKYYFGGSVGGSTATTRVYGKALVTYSYDGEGNLAGRNQALSVTTNMYDNEVHGWNAQLPEQCFSIRTDTDNAANDVLYGYGNNGYISNTIWAGDTSWTDYSVETKVKFLGTGSGSAGIVIRSGGDLANCYSAALAYSDSGSDYVNLSKSSQMVQTFWSAQPTNLVTGQWYTLKVSVNGSNIQVFKDGSLIFNVTDTNIANGKVGLKVFNTGVVFDNVKITGPDGTVWKYDDFQAKGDLSSTLTTDRVSGLPSGESYLYDANNRPYARTDQNKRTITVTRDEKGNVIAEANPAGTVKLDTYDSNGNLISQTAPMQPSYNYVPNPSFEYIYDWYLTSRDTTSTVSYDSTNAYHGSSALKLNYNGTDWIGAQSSLMPVRAGEDYTISAFVKSTGFTQADGLQHHHVYLRFWTSNDPNRPLGNFKGQFGAEIPASSTGYDWQRIFKSVAVPSGATYADVLIVIIGSSGVASTVWVDGVQLELGAVASEFNYVQNPGASSGTSSWNANFPTNTSVTVAGNAPTNNNWASLPDGWGISDKGEMGACFWYNRAGLTETTLTSTNSYDSSHMTFSSKIKMDTGRDVGLAFRIQNNDNMYLVRCSGLQGDKDNPNNAGETTYKTALWKKQGGVWSKLSTGGDGARMIDATGAALIPQTGSWYTVYLDLDGTTIRWWYQVDGVRSIDYGVIDYNNPFTTGMVGFRVGSENGYSQNFHHFDNVVVTAGTGSFTDNFDVYNPYFQESHTTSSASSSWQQALIDKTVIPGQNYTLLAKVYTATAGTGSGGARLRIIWRDSSGNDMSGRDECSPFYNTGGTWLSKAISAIAPDGAASARVSLEQANFQGETRFDDVRFERSVGQAGFSLIGNGSFETIDASNGKAAGWSYDNLANWELDTKTFKYGKSSIKVSTPGPGNSWATQELLVKPSTTYILSAWVKTSAVAARMGAGALLCVLSGGEAYTTVPAIGDTDWNLQALQFTTGPNVSIIKLGILQGFGRPSSGTTWFDGIQLTEKSPWESYYTYDTNGNFVTGTLDSSGTPSRYVLNNVGDKTQSIIDQRSSDGSLTALSTQYTFDHAGRLLSTIYPADSSGSQEVVSSTYDKSGNKLTQTVLLPGSDVATTTYTYNAAGLRATEEDPHAQLFADDFSSGANFPNGTNFWTSQHTTQWTIQSDNSFRGTASGSWITEMSLAGKANWGNYVYQASVKIESGWTAGLLFHSGGQFASDYCLFELQPSMGQWVLYGSDAGGTTTQIASGPYGVSMNTLYQLKLVVNGSAASIFINNTNVWSNSLGAAHTKGKIGLLVGANGNGSGAARFYNVQVTEAGSTTYAYDLAGRLQTEARALGDNATRTSYTYDSLGRNLSKTYQDTLSNPATYSIKTSSTHNETGNKLTETDALGNVTRYAYDAAGACASFDRLGNLTSTIRSISQDNLSERGAIDARGNMEVDLAGAAGVVSTTDQRNYTVKNTYSGQGSLASRVDAGLAPYQFSYDALGRPGFFRDPFGNDIKFAYDSLGRRTLRTDARGLEQTFTYDNLGRPIARGDSSRSDSQTAPARFGWDVAGRAVYAINAGDTAHFVDYSYDTAGKLVKAAYYDGKSAAFSYSSFGGLASVRDLSQSVTSYSHDQIGRLQNLGSSYYTGGAGLTLTYDAAGNVLTRLNPDGTSESYTYDKENRMLSYSLTKNGSSIIAETYDYDANGNRTAVTDLVTSKTTTYVYDAANQLTQVNQGVSNSIYTYDANGNRTLIQSQNYDHFDSDLSNWTSANMTPWTIESGELNNTTANGYLTSASKYASTDFSARINQKSGNDVGLVFRYQDDNNWYLLRCSGADGASMVIYKDVGGVATLLASTPVTTRAAIGAEQWYTLRVTTNGSTFYGEYTFNGVTTLLVATDATFAAGKVGFRGAASGHHHFDDTVIRSSASYAYDAANQLTSATDPAAAATGLGYDASGNNISEGIIYRTFDERNRLTGTSASATAGVTYAYNALGNLFSRGTRQALLADDFSAGLTAWSNTADWAGAQDQGNAVAQANGLAGPIITYRSAGAGDYTFSTRVKMTAAGQSNASMGIIFCSDASPNGYAPDHNGYSLGLFPGQGIWKLWKVTAGVFGAGNNFNPLASGSRTFSLNQDYAISARVQAGVITIYVDGALLTTATDPSPYSGGAVGLKTRYATVCFDDVRVDAPALAASTFYRYNPVTGALMHELDASGNITVTYIADDKGNPVSVTRYNSGQATTCFYHYNAHGDVIAITDAGGNVVAKFSYDAWGVPSELNAAGAQQAIGSWTTATGGTPGQGLFLLFGSMLYDAAAGIYLTRTRAYNPKTGRFLSRDILDEDAKDGYDGFPFGKDAIGTNLYAWCGNNPVTRVDPSGMSWFTNLIHAATRMVTNIARIFYRVVRTILRVVAPLIRAVAKIAVAVVKAVVAPVKAVIQPKVPSVTTVSRPSNNAYMPSDPESFEGGRKIAEGIHWAHANIEAPAFMLVWAPTGVATGAALEGACLPTIAGAAACAPASGGLIVGGAALSYGEYRIWEGSDTYKAAASVWDRTPTIMSPVKQVWEIFH